MAGYFSNHSQSRFLANSGTGTSQTNATAGVHAAPQQAAIQSTLSRSRAPSKHFSTSVSTSGDEKLLTKEKAASNGPANGAVHPLRNTWVFWFRQQRHPGNKITNYEEGIKKISAFSSVESFWSIWTHLYPPSGLLPTTDYLLFHAGVRRPVWEDPLNLSGGKWIIRLRKGVADRIWEDLILAVIGDQFDECRSDGDQGETAGHSSDATANGEWPEICGCTISVRQSEDIVSVWNRDDGDTRVKERIRDTLRKVLNLSPSTIMEYKSNNDSMQDKSSFRNSAIDRSSLQP